MNSKKIGYLAGVFDFCHQGHINIIRHASKLCDELIVAVVSDSFAFKYKKQTIFHSQEERIEMIAKLELELNIVVVDNNDHEFFFNKYNVTHLFHGTDWKKEPYIDFMGRDSIEKRKINVVMLPHTKGISSTALRKLQIERKGIDVTGDITA
tara:strand:+ start:103 stop:558 length:456 start_codon:yes stop_codon:yes gene_type:complete